MAGQADLNSWYGDSSAFPFQLTKRLEVDAKGFRAFHGFDDAGEDEAPWFQRVKKAKKQREAQEATAYKKPVVYNSATEPVQLP